MAHQESIFVTQPPGFVNEGMEDKVYRLNKHCMA